MLTETSNLLDNHKDDDRPREDQSQGSIQTTSTMSTTTAMLPTTRRLIIEAYSEPGGIMSGRDNVRGDYALHSYVELAKRHLCVEFIIKIRHSTLQLYTTRGNNN